MQKWPSRIPQDLLAEFDRLAQYRYSTAPQDYWIAVREWLEQHGIEPPDHDLPREPEQNRAEGQYG